MHFPYFWHELFRRWTITKNKSVVNCVEINLTFSNFHKGRIIFKKIKNSELFMDFLNTIWIFLLDLTFENGTSYFLCFLERPDNTILESSLNVLMI